MSSFIGTAIPWAVGIFFAIIIGSRLLKELLAELKTWFKPKKEVKEKPKQKPPLKVLDAQYTIEEKG